MTAGMLFWKRWRDEIGWQWNVWRSAVDWTVALYFVIPACIAGVVQYQSWWKPDAWLTYLPLPVAVLIFYSLAWSAHLRLFVREADLLVLRQERWIQGLMVRGVMISAIGQALRAGGWVLVFLPWMRVHHSWEWIVVGLWGWILWLSFLFIPLVKQLLPLRVRGWKRVICLIVLFFSGIPLFWQIGAWADVGRAGMLTVVALTGSAAVAGLIRFRISVRGLIEVDIRRERRYRLRWTALLLQAGQVTPSRRGGQRRRPWLFRRSQALGRGNMPRDRLFQAAMKSTLRSWQRLSLLFQITAVASMGVWNLPGMGSWVLLLAVPWILTMLSSQLWREFIQSPYLRMFTWSGEDRAWACLRFALVITWTGSLVLVFTCSFVVSDWWNVLLAFAGSGLSGWLAAWFLHQKERYRPSDSVSCH